MMSGRKEFQKEYRKKWMANRRKIHWLKKTYARVVAQSDSDSDTDNKSFLSPSIDVQDLSVQASSAHSRW